MPFGIREHVEARHPRLRVYDYPPSECSNAQRADSDTDSHSDAVSYTDSKPDHAMLISAAEKYNEPFQHVVSVFVEFVMGEEPLTEVGAALLSMGRVVQL